MLAKDKTEVLRRAVLLRGTNVLITEVRVASKDRSFTSSRISQKEWESIGQCWLDLLKRLVLFVPRMIQVIFCFQIRRRDPDARIHLTWDKLSINSQVSPSDILLRPTQQSSSLCEAPQQTTWELYVEQLTKQIHLQPHSWSKGTRHDCNGQPKINLMRFQNCQVYVCSEENGGVELQEREVIGQTLISTKIDFQFAKYPQQGVDSQMSRRSTPAPQRRNRLTKSLSVGDSLGRECVDDDGAYDYDEHIGPSTVAVLFLLLF